MKYKEGISICITAYHTKKYICELLDSIQHQTWIKNHDNYEILLGIDSDQELLDFIKSVKYKYKNLRVLMMNKNYGTYIVSNTLMSVAQYNTLARVDSDDVLEPTLIEEIMKRSQYDLVRYKLYNYDENLRNCENVPQLAMGVFVMSKHAFEISGGYMPWKCGADSELYYRLRKYLKVRYSLINKVLYKRRVHSDSLTRSADTGFKSELRKQYQDYINHESHKNLKIKTVIGGYVELPEFSPVFNNRGEIVNKEYVKNYFIQRMFTKKRMRMNLDNPRTIQEKIAYLMINECSKLKTDCADKIRVHDYCKEVLGQDICVPIIAVYDRPQDIEWNKLPDKFIIKCNHGSRMNLYVKDKKKIDINDVNKTLTTWLNKNIGIHGEVQYINIVPKIMVEQYLEDETQKESLIDYKFWCMNGVPKLYTMNAGHGHGDIMYYDVQNNQMLDLYRVGKEKFKDFKKPKNFELMKNYAKKLSSLFKFVRVDFYEVNGQVYLGEMTFTPGGCGFKYSDPQDDIKIGNMLKI